MFEFNGRVMVMAKPPARGAEVEVFHPVWTSQPVNTDKATRETGEPEHAGNEGGGSVWWAFTAPYDGLLSVVQSTPRSTRSWELMSALG